MSGCETEKAEGYHPVKSHTKENEESNGSISVSPGRHRMAGLKPPSGLHYRVKHKQVFCFAFVNVIINVALILVIISISVRPRGSCPALPTCPVASCPNDWVGYEGKCYYFAMAEGNWTSSKMHCSSLNASLAVVDSQAEMDFMLRYKGFTDHWIGLQRNPNQPWKWINGTIFNSWFAVPGGENCANMNQQGIASSSCSREEPWICSKPVVG